MNKSKGTFGKKTLQIAFMVNLGVPEETKNNNQEKASPGRQKPVFSFSSSVTVA